MTSRNSAGTRLPELDGLRAFAILPVLLVHFAPLGRWPLLDAGWLGVDLFFVLSGFLITGLLLDGVKRPHYYRNFVVRRALRIFPLYYACLVLLLGSLYFGADATQWDALLAWANPIWFVLFLGNFVAAARDVFPPVFALGVLWSLQVEEQFYLLYPLAIARLSTRALRNLLIACIVAAPLLRIVRIFAWPEHALASYVLMPLRMDSLALGGLVALLVRSRTKVLSTTTLGLIALCGLATVGWIVLFRTSDYLDPVMQAVGYTAFDSACAAILVLILESPDAVATRALRFAPLVHTGKISFGLYLLHIPVGRLTRGIAGSFLEMTPHGALEIVLSMAATFTVATLSWSLFESKILALKGRFL